MSKKLVKVLAIATLLVVCVAALVACNAYEWNSIGGGDSNATVESNGGYFVKQGNYAYFVNGNAGESTDGNEWGKVVKGSIVRAEYKDGTIDNTTSKIVVPKNVYTTTSGSGIAVFGDWIYYATYNYDKDKNGNQSTTDLDFMRTKIDASVTQKIGTISSRTAEYKFTPSRVLYYADSKISYIDYSGMKTDKSLKSPKGTKKGVIAENVTSVLWKYADTYKAGSIEDYIFYTQSLTGTDSYKNYNNLYAVKYDGSNNTLLATNTTYTNTPNTSFQDVYKFTLVSIYFDSEDTATLYYTKSFYKDGADTTKGLYCAQFKNGALDTANEKELNTIASTTIFPLGFELGALCYNSNSIYCYYDGTNSDNPVQINEAASAKAWKVDGDYVYYTESDAEELFKINFKETENVKSVIVACMNASWYPIEFVGDIMYFYSDDDNNYLQQVNLAAYNQDDENTYPTMIGIYAEGDEPEKDSEEE